MTRILLLRPSTEPLEISPLAQNQFRSSSSWERSMRATLRMGSSRLRRARSHYTSRKVAAQVREW